MANKRGPGRPKVDVQTVTIGARVDPKVKTRLVEIARRESRSLCLQIAYVLKTFAETYPQK